MNISTEVEAKKLLDKVEALLTEAKSRLQQLINELEIDDNECIDYFECGVYLNDSAEPIDTNCLSPNFGQVTQDKKMMACLFKRELGIQTNLCVENNMVIKDDIDKDQHDLNNNKGEKKGVVEYKVCHMTNCVCRAFINCSI